MKIRMRTNLNTKKRVISGFDFNGEYIRGIEWDVIAIIRSSNILAYLVIFNNIPGRDDAIDWVDSRNFDTIDNEKPDNWVECAWPWWRPYKKMKANVEYDFRLTYYCGPKELLENDSFLFDIYENRRKAIQYLNEVSGLQRNVNPLKKPDECSE